MSKSKPRNLSIIRVDVSDPSSTERCKEALRSIGLKGLSMLESDIDFYVVIDWSNKRAFAEVSPGMIAEKVKYMLDELSTSDTISIISSDFPPVPTVPPAAKSVEDPAPDSCHTLAQELRYITREVAEQGVNKDAVTKRLDLISEIAHTAKAIGLQDYEIQRLQILKRPLL